MPHLDCTITIINDQKLTIEYLDERDVQVQKDGLIGTDPIAQLTVERMNGWVNYGLAARERFNVDVLESDDLRVIGLNLYRILFGDKEVAKIFRGLYDRFAKTMANAQVRMRLRLAFGEGAQRLSRLPWEFLYIPSSDENLTHGFFFGEKDQLILSRIVDADPPIETEGERPLKIMVFVYGGFENMNSISQDHLGFVLTAISNLATPSRHDNLPYGELSKILREEQPDIPHFVGHGEGGKLTLVKSPLDDDYDEAAPHKPQVRWVSAQDFRRLLDYSAKPKLVFLQSCKGAQPGAQVTLGCAQELVDLGVPAVIAMQHSISNADASFFAQCFYTELAGENTIDESVRAGRVLLGRRNPPWAHPRFGSPVVYLRRDNIKFRRTAVVEKTAETTTGSGVLPAALPGVAAAPRQAPQPSRQSTERAPEAPASGFGVR